MTLMQVGLDDKYRLEAKRIYLSGIQALVRLPMLQRERDRAQNLACTTTPCGARNHSCNLRISPSFRA